MPVSLSSGASITPLAKAVAARAGTGVAVASGLVVGTDTRPRSMRVLPGTAAAASAGAGGGDVSPPAAAVVGGGGAAIAACLR